MDIITAGTALTLSKQLLGKTFDVISEDIAKLYANGRDKIILKMSQKVTHHNDGRSANLRVTRDVFWNGSFSDEAICAEYFGGILASSRSDDGTDDTGVYYVDLIKSLSSRQLKLHYIIYICLNRILIADPGKANVNPGQDTELVTLKVCLSLRELQEIIGEVDIGRELHALHAKRLVGDFKSEIHKLEDERSVPYVEVSPTALGVQLYATAHNKLSLWRKFSTDDFGAFESMPIPKFQSSRLESFLEKFYQTKRTIDNLDPSASKLPKRKLPKSPCNTPTNLALNPSVPPHKSG
jgi:hypothetical protein